MWNLLLCYKKVRKRNSIFSNIKKMLYTIPMILMVSVGICFLLIVLVPNYGIAGDLYSEDFESLGVGDNMEANGFTHYPYAAEDASFLVTAGKYGEIKATVLNWCGGMELDAGAAWTDYRITFNIISYGGGRWIFGFRSTAAGAYWVQSLPGAQVRLFKGDRNFLGGLTILNIWDAQDPGPPHTSAEIVVVGTSITLYINDTLVGTTTDATFSTGSIIIGGYQAGWVVDNISVSSIPIATPTYTVTPTSTPTPTFTPTITPTATQTVHITPGVYAPRRILIYDDRHHKMVQDDAHHILLYDDKRRKLLLE